MNMNFVTKITILFFTTIKKILNIKNPVVLKDGTCIMDNGFYIIEILPKNEKYRMRLYLKEQKKTIEYYFDISFENRIDKFKQNLGKKDKKWWL